MSGISNNMEELILESAEKLFLEKGFASTSTTEIAKLSGCNQALVHYYYRTKQKLFEAVFKRKVSMFKFQLVSINDKTVTFKDKLARNIEAHFDMLCENQTVSLFLINELTTNPKRDEIIKEIASNIPAELFAQLENEFKSEIKRGKIREIEFLDLIVSILSLNVMVFIMKPILSGFSGMSEDAYNEFLQRRRKENVDFIISSLTI